MNELFDSTVKLLVLVVTACIAIRLAYDAIRPALPLIGVVIVVAAIWRLIRWHRERW